MRWATYLPAPPINLCSPQWMDSLQALPGFLSSPSATLNLKSITIRLIGQQNYRSQGGPRVEIDSGTLIVLNEGIETDRKANILGTVRRCQSLLCVGLFLFHCRWKSFQLLVRTSTTKSRFFDSGLLKASIWFFICSDTSIYIRISVFYELNQPVLKVLFGKSLFSCIEN